MKKKVLSALLCASMVATMVAGCGSSEDTTATGDNTATPATEATDAAGAETGSADAVANLIAATEGTVEIDLWCSELEAYQTVMASLVEDFKAQYPEVDFNITIGSCSEADTKDRVLEDVEAAADVFVFADDQLQELVNAGALQAVETTFTYDVATANTESTVEAASLNGTLYAYPLTASNGYFLFYDSTVFSEEDVASWDSLLAKAEEEGVKVGMDVGNAWYLYGFFAGAGLELSMNEDQSNTCNWNATDTTPTGADVANAISAICASDAFVACNNTDATASAANGEMKAYVDGTWDSSAFQDAYGEGYAAAKLPTYTCADSQIQMGSYAGYKFVGVNSYSDQIGWSMILAEFITNETSQAAIGAATGEGPANIVAASSEEILAQPALAALAAQAEFADLQRVGGAFWDPAASLGQNLVEGNNSDVQALLDEAVEGITQPVATE